MRHKPGQRVTVQAETLFPERLTGTLEKVVASQGGEMAYLVRLEVPAHGLASIIAFESELSSLP